MVHIGVWDHRAEDRVRVVGRELISNMLLPKIVQKLLLRTERGIGPVWFGHHGSPLGRNATRKAH